MDTGIIHDFAVVRLKFLSKFEEIGVVFVEEKTIGNNFVNVGVELGL